MSVITCKVVRHDGGWAYEVNGAVSETFRTGAAARAAAQSIELPHETPWAGGYGARERHRNWRK